MVGHGHVQVNGRKVSIPSYFVRRGETISLTDDASQIPLVIEEIETDRPIPDWLARERGYARVQRLPERGDIELPINEDLILACYAR